MTLRFVFHYVLWKILIALTRFPILGLNVVIKSKNEQNNAKLPHGEPHSRVNAGKDERLKIIIFKRGKDILPFVLYYTR